MGALGKLVALVLVHECTAFVPAPNAATWAAVPRQSAVAGAVWRRPSSTTPLTMIAKTLTEQDSDDAALAAAASGAGSEVCASLRRYSSFFEN
jgi:hypothetical protein